MRCSATGIALVHDVWHEIVDGNCLGAVCNLVRNAGQSRGIASFGRSCAFVDTILSGLTVLGPLRRAATAIQPEAGVALSGFTACAALDHDLRMHHRRLL
jgi:hypothetical protein